MTYPDEKVLLVKLLRPLLPGVVVTAEAKTGDAPPVIVIESSSIAGTFEQQRQRYRIRLMTSAKTHAESRATAIKAHEFLLSFGEKKTGIPEIGWVGTVKSTGGAPTQYAAGAKLHQHIAFYEVTIRPPK